MNKSCITHIIKITIVQLFNDNSILTILIIFILLMLLFQHKYPRVYMYKGQRLQTRLQKNSLENDPPTSQIKTREIFPKHGNIHQYTTLNYSVTVFISKSQNIFIKAICTIFLTFPMFICLIGKRQSLQQFTLAKLGYKNTMNIVPLWSPVPHGQQYTLPRSPPGVKIE